jgi:hypothetical protein
VLLCGAALTPATLLGAWVGKEIVDRISDLCLPKISSMQLRQHADTR